MWGIVVNWVIGIVVGLYLLLATYVNIVSYLEKKKENAAYQKSLFKQLYIINQIISYNQEEQTFQDFKEISKKILNLGKNPKTKMENMLSIDSLAFHEKNALIKVLNALNQDIPITDENIKNALIEVTKRLNKQYKEFCNLQTADVQLETHYLQILQQKEAERLELEQ